MAQLYLIMFVIL